MTLRILHLLDHSLPLHSGYVFRTLSILKEQRKFGWHTYQLTSPKQGAVAAELEAVDGWEFYRTRSSQGMLARLPVARELQLMRHRAAPGGAWCALAACHPCPFAGAQRAPGDPGRPPAGIPVVSKCVPRGKMPPSITAPRQKEACGTGCRWLETQALRRADQVTTICEGLRSDIVGRGISPAKVTVIPNAVDVNAFEYDVPPDEALRNSLGLRGATVLGSRGRSTATRVWTWWWRRCRACSRPSPSFGRCSWAEALRSPR